jgi:uncharacterized protein (TIGR02270 family)
MHPSVVIPSIIEQYCESAASLWLVRDYAVGASSIHLAELIRLDERIEANVDGLLIAEAAGWSGPLPDRDGAGAEDFFVAGLLAVEGGNAARLDQVIDCAYAKDAATAGEPYLRADDPWRALVAAIAWAERQRAAIAIGRLLGAPRARSRWLGVAACGARRMVQQSGLDTALADAEPLVRARAARTAGELGRVDLTAELNAHLADEDENCRFWAAWSGARLGTSEGMHALAEFARSAGPRGQGALDLLLRCLSAERAVAFMRPLAQDPTRRRAVIQATGAIGDARYVPWLIGEAQNPFFARVAGDAFAAITGADLSGLGQELPAIATQSPNDDPENESVALDPDDGLVWPDPEKLGAWWKDNGHRFAGGSQYFLGTEKASVDWIRVLSEADQRTRRIAALELALRSPGKSMLEVRARGNMQRRLLRLAGASA